MPAQDRIGCDNGGQLHQLLAAQRLAFDGQEPTLVIGQRESFLPMGFHHGLQLRLVELDDFLHLAMDPAEEDHEEELPRLEDEHDGSPGAVQWGIDSIREQAVKIKQPK